MREGDGNGEHSLYDLATDPGEQTNLTKLNSTKRRMVKMYEQWRTDTLPTAIVTGEANPPHAGIVSGGAAYVVGGKAVVVATAWNGWHFTGWSDGDMTNPRTVVVPATDSTYTAHFTR